MSSTFFGEVPAVRYLEALQPMRLEAVRLPDATHARSTTLATAAMLRVLQCVAASGRCCIVSATTVLTLRAEIFGLRPGRVSSRSIPVTPSAMNRPR
jgi:hypothetical protein